MSNFLVIDLDAARRGQGCIRAQQAPVCESPGGVVNSLRDGNGYLGDLSKKALDLAGERDEVLKEALIEKVT